MRSRVSLLSWNSVTIEELDASIRATACSNVSPRSCPGSFTTSPVVAVGGKEKYQALYDDTRTRASETRSQRNDQLTGQCLNHLAERRLEALPHLSDGFFFRKQLTLELADCVLSFAQLGLEGLELSCHRLLVLDQQKDILFTSKEDELDEGIG
jgi:hypothetical protein